MNGISVAAGSSLQDICGPFQDCFPYLFLAFYSREEGRKKDASSGKAAVTPISDLTLRIADIGSLPTGENAELRIEASMTVGGLAAAFLQTFGVHAAVAYRDPFGEALLAPDEEKGKTLAAFNALCQKKGCKERPGFTVEVDDSSVRSDRVTYIFRCIHRDVREKIPRIEPLTDAHHAGGKRAWLYREYTAGVANSVIEALYLAWDPDERLFGYGYIIAPPETIARTIGRLPTAKETAAFYRDVEKRCTEAGINFDEETRTCIHITTDVTYESFLDFGPQFNDPLCALYKTVEKIYNNALNAVFGNEFEAIRQRVSAEMAALGEKLAVRENEDSMTPGETAPPPAPVPGRPRGASKVKTILIAAGAVLLVARLLVYLFGSSG